jgi:dTDP-4-amino-4,6-dideoxygalactose transaminase
MTVSRLALLGGAPQFERERVVGQFNFPPWPQLEDALRGIFARRYYNNDGPLLGELEERLRTLFDTRHAICVHNETLGLLMLADALRPAARSIVPGFGAPASAQALSRAGLDFDLCDADPAGARMATDHLEALLARPTGAIFAASLWGDLTDLPTWQRLAGRAGCPLIIDASHVCAPIVGGRPLARQADAVVYALGKENMLNALEGGCICTDDDQLAARLRTMRPSYGDFPAVPVHRVANARMSEAQAALLLLSLDAFETYRSRNAGLRASYVKALEAIPGVALFEPGGDERPSMEHAVCRIDSRLFGLSASATIATLHAEGVIARRPSLCGIPSRGNLARAIILQTDTVVLPLGSPVSEHDIATIGELLEISRHHASELTSAHVE